jgi:hypothetical protein
MNQPRFAARPQYKYTLESLEISPEAAGFAEKYR